MTRRFRERSYILEWRPKIRLTVIWVSVIFKRGQRKFLQSPALFNLKKLLASAMVYTLYDGTIVVLQGILNTLIHILHQAEKHTDATTLLESRLHEDMYPLPDQVRLTTQWSENLVARLMGRKPVTFGSKLTSFSDFYERIDVVLKSLSEADKEIVNQHGDIVESTAMGPGKEVDMSGDMYAHTIVLPNVYFHLTTTYGILRKEGVPLGKLDYYTGFFPKQVTGLK